MHQYKYFILSCIIIYSFWTACILFKIRKCPPPFNIFLFEENLKTSSYSFPILPWLKKTRTKFVHKNASQLAEGIIFITGHIWFMEILCLNDISIHTNFDQNRSINECARKSCIKVFLYNLGWHLSLNLTFKKSVSSLCWNSWKAFKGLGVKQIIYRRKKWFGI